MAGYTIIVSCMDRRLNDKFDKENDSKKIFVRNAGGNVLGVEQTLRYLVENMNISSIKVVAHTDCGAMGYVYESLKSGKDGILEQLVEEFKQVSFSTRQELEKKNEELQASLLNKLFGNTFDISSELVELKESADKQGEHFAVVTKASEMKYGEIAKALGLSVGDCYFIQANSISEILPDITLAIERLGIKKFFLASLDPSQYRQVYADFQMLKTRGILEKANFEIARL